MLDIPVTPELALIDPELRREAIAALPAGGFPRIAPRPRPAAAANPPLVVAAAVYAGVVFGRILAAGVALALILIVLSAIALVLR